MRTRTAGIAGLLAAVGVRDPLEEGAKAGQEAKRKQEAKGASGPDGRAKAPEAPPKDDPAKKEERLREPRSA